MKPVKMIAKIKNGNNLTLSATVPLIIDIVVAQKTIWKNQSDIFEYPSAALTSASGFHNVGCPIKPLTSLYMKP